VPDPSPSLDLSVDRDGDVPLATQLAWKLRTFVAVGALAPGDRLPGVREVAEAAGVNVNTVRSVYGRLEEEGLISSQHGRGTFVARDAAPRDALGRIAATAAAQARSAGLDPREVAAALFVDAPGPERSASGPADHVDPPSRGAPSERDRRRELRADIARLEGEMAWLLPPGEEAAPLRLRPRPGQILSAAELQAIRDELAERVSLLRAERFQARSAAEARRVAPEAAEPRPAAEGRVWRHGGVWTGALRRDGVVYES
jgi:GntR family transcriptional regulator